MKIFKNIAVALGLVATPQPAPATPVDENWFGFHRVDDSGERIIIIDRWISTAAANSYAHCFTVEFAIPPEQRRPNGMPDEDTLAKQYAVEDALSRSFSSDTMRNVISRTTVGQRSIAFCSIEAETAQKANLILAEFKPVAFEIMPSMLQQLRSYLPTHLEQMIAENARILGGLAAEGDDGSQQRQVDHLIIFKDGSERAAIKSILMAEGYRIDSEEADRLEFSFVTSLEQGQADEFVYFLNDLCEKNHCFYDGWATPVVR